MKIEMQRFGKSYKPRKKTHNRRNALVGILVFLLVAILVVAIVSICIESIIRYLVIPGQEETWAASVASYWGWHRWRCGFRYACFSWRLLYDSILQRIRCEKGKNSGTTISYGRTRTRS